jgi:hypothetical protein
MGQNGLKLWRWPLAVLAVLVGGGLAVRSGVVPLSPRATTPPPTALSQPIAPPADAVIPSAAVTDAALTDAALDQLMQVSGMSDFISAVPQRVQDAVLQQTPLNDEARLQLAQKLNDGSLTDGLVQDAHNTLRTELDRSAYAAVLQWFSTDIGLKFINAERAANNPAGRQAMQQAIAQSSGQTVDFDRAQLMQSLDAATETSATYRLVFDDLLALLQEKITDPTLLKPMTQTLKRNQADAELAMSAAMLYLYRELPDADVQAAITFYQTPAGKQWVALARGLARRAWQVINRTSMTYLPQPTPAPTPPPSATPVPANTTPP